MVHRVSFSLWLQSHILLKVGRVVERGMWTIWKHTQLTAQCPAYRDVLSLQHVRDYTGSVNKKHCDPPSRLAALPAVSIGLYSLKAADLGVAVNDSRHFTFDSVAFKTLLCLSIIMFVLLTAINSKSRFNYKVPLLF